MAIRIGVIARVIKVISLSLALVFSFVGCDKAEVKQSSDRDKLPVCKGTQESTWSDCIGESKFSGGEYYGEYKNGKYQGKGIIVFDNGDRFEGYFKGGLKDGRGEYSFQNGDIFEGDFKGGLREGVASYNYKDGRKFVGEYKDDKRFNGRELNAGGALTREWANGEISNSARDKDSSITNGTPNADVLTLASAQQLNVPSEESGNHSAHCTEKWSTRGVLDKNMFNVCMRDQAEAYVKLRLLALQYRKMDWIQNAVDYSINMWTKRGSRADDLVFFTLNEITEGYEDMLYESQKPGWNKAKYASCSKLSSFRFDLIMFCYKKM